MSVPFTSVSVSASTKVTLLKLSLESFSPYVSALLPFTDTVFPLFNVTSFLSVILIVIVYTASS